jgi:uncharacterized protein
MYNSQNLPLKKKKIIKKTVSAFAIYLSLCALASVMVVPILIFGVEFKRWFLLISIFLIITLLITIWAYIYQNIYFKNYYYNFEEDKAEIKKGVVAMATGHVRYARIQNVFVDQDFWDRIFGLYDVHYETAGEISGFYSHVDGLNKENADKLVQFINDKTNYKENGSEKFEKKETEVLQDKVMSDNDQRIFTRENIPIERRIIFKTLPSSLIWYYISILVYSVNILFREVPLTFLEFISSIYTITFYVIIPLLIVIWSYIYYNIWYKNFYFKFDQESGTIKQGVVATSDVHVYYNRIQNIDISQTTIERMLGICCLVIETASAGTKLGGIVIPGLKKENAEILKSFLLEKSKKQQTI